MIVAGKAASAFMFTISSSLFVSMRANTVSSFQILHHLCWEFIIKDFQKTLGLFMPSYVVPPADTGMIKAHSKDQILWN